jgi:hypothetical protein
VSGLWGRVVVERSANGATVFGRIEGRVGVREQLGHADR